MIFTTFSSTGRIRSIKLRGLHRKVSTYYEDYQNLGYRPTDALVKDWNDALQYQVFTLQEARLLEAVYQRNNEEEMKIIKDEQTKSTKHSHCLSVSLSLSLKQTVLVKQPCL